MSNPFDLKTTNIALIDEHLEKLSKAHENLQEMFLQVLDNIAEEEWSYNPGPLSRVHADQKAIHEAHQYLSQLRRKLEAALESEED